MGRKRIRRTKAEIEAGVTVEQKKAQLKEEAAKKAQEAVKAAEEENKQDAQNKKKPRKKKKASETNIEDLPQTSKPLEDSFLRYTQTPKEPVVKTEIVKEVRVLNTAGTEKTVQQILNEELKKCTWEWTRLPIVENFKVEQLNKLGKEGWTFAFIFEPNTIKDSWKNKHNEICLYRVKKDESSKRRGPGNKNTSANARQRRSSKNAKREKDNS